MTGTELTIVLIAVIVGAIVKAVTGMGLPIIAIPIAALFVDLDDAVVTIAFPNLLMNGVLAFRERSHLSETRDLPTLAVAGVAGAVVGAIAFVSLPEEPLVILLVIAILGYVITFFAKPDLQIGPAIQVPDKAGQQREHHANTAVECQPCQVDEQTSYNRQFHASVLPVLNRYS